MLSVPMCSSSLTSLRETLRSWDRNEKKKEEEVKTTGKEEKKKKTSALAAFPLRLYRVC